MKILSGLCSLLLVSTVAFGSSASLPKDFKLKGLTEKKTMQMKNIRNDTTVLQFWASWCTGCGKNMEVLSQLKKKMGPDNFNFVPVSVDESKAQALAYFDGKPNSIKKLKELSYLDVDAKLATKLNIGSLPALVVVDRNGKILSRMSGHLGQAEVNKLKGVIKESK